MSSKLKTAISAAGLALALNSCSNHPDPKTVRLNDWVVTIYEDDGKKNLKMHPENMDGDKCYIEVHNFHQYYNQRRGKYMGTFDGGKFHHGEDPVCASKVLLYKDNFSDLADIYEQAKKAEEPKNK